MTHEALYKRFAKYRSEWIKHQIFLLPYEELITHSIICGLDEIMEELTNLTFNDLRQTFDFRFSGAIIRPDLNLDNCVLTLPTHKETGKYGLPGGKIDVTKMPFSAFVFALFLQSNRRKYEEGVFINGDYNAPLVRVLDRNRSEEIERYVVPLERLAKEMDFPFEKDNHSDIRLEGYRELEEEMDLQKPTKSKRSEFRDKKAVITGAERVGIFLDRYRVARPMGDEVAKKWFVSFNYLIHVSGTRELITKTVTKGLDASGEAEGVRWASLAEVSRPGYEGMYHDTVHYVAVRMDQLDIANTDARHGRRRRKSRKRIEEETYQNDKVVVENPFR